MKNKVRTPKVIVNDEKTIVGFENFDFRKIEIENPEPNGLLSITFLEPSDKRFKYAKTEVCQ